MSNIYLKMSYPADNSAKNAKFAAMEGQVIHIGVAVAAYNVERWLGRCIDSVRIAAEHVRDAVSVSIVVADDGSTDATRIVADEFAAKDSRVTALALPHGGQAAARAAAIAAMPGDTDFVMIVDADDTLPATSLAQLARLIGADVDIVCSNVLKITEDDSTEPYLYMDNGDTTTFTPTEALARMLDNVIPNYTHGMLIRRRLFDRIDWDTHQTMTNAEDAMLQLLLTAAATGKVVVAPGAIGYEYRHRRGTLSSMVRVSPEGIERVWHSVSRVPEMPRTPLIRWGLGLMHLYFIGRGVRIRQSYAPARDLRRMARHTSLDSPTHRRVLLLLRCPLLRDIVTARHRRVRIYPE